MIVLNAGLPYSGYLWVARAVSRIGLLKQRKFKFVFSDGERLISDIMSGIESEGDQIIVTTQWHPDLEETVARHWDSVYTVSTIRDPRDVTVSLMEREQMDLDTALATTKESVSDFFRIYNSVDANVVVHEQMIKDPAKVIFALSSTLELTIQLTRAQRLTKMTAKVHNQSYASTDSEIKDVAVSPNSEIDVTGVNGSWRNYFDENDQKRVDSEFASLLQKLPYKLAFS